ncbi:MAG TPA: VOC family protein [Flavisolibacter sp.]|jgi:catechol 2,3-dioxygenase-like lactoylglutathione lyase family enzyme|nr:VOC family protein [Flavisolibacter sp.]
MNNLLRIGISFLLICACNTLLPAQTLKVGPIGITVRDLDRSVSFYTEVLGFKKVGETEVFGESVEKEKNLFGIRMKIARLQLGDEFIELTDYLTSGGRSIPEDAKSNDLIFQHIAIVVNDMDKAYQQLRQHHVEQVSTGPQTLPLSNIAAAGIRAFYFRDPDGHNLELIYFPKGKGQAKWQIANLKIFLGIDHTAIGVSDTEKSLQFYRDLLGIERKGDSWNKGTEQEHLNYVKGASLHITGMRAAGGPGVEFLQYLIPGAGKAYPADTKSDDLWYWETTIYVDDAQSLFNKLKSTGAHILSEDIVSLTGTDHSLYLSFIVRDPDGHAIQVMQPVKK